MAGELTRNGVIKVEDSFPGYSLDSFLIPQHYAEDLEYVLIPEGLLCDRIERLAADILSSYPPGETIVCICVLKSAFGFFSALSNALQRVNLRNNQGNSNSKDMYSLTSWDENGNEQAGRNATRPLLYEFIRVQSYLDDHSSGTVEIQGIGDMISTVQGKHTLVIEDMIDTGATMQKVLEQFEECEPKSLKVATLLRKRCPTATGYIPDFLGFDIPDKFVVGFSIDYNQHFRDVQHLCVVNDRGKRKYASKPQNIGKQIEMTRSLEGFIILLNHTVLRNFIGNRGSITCRLNR